TPVSRRCASGCCGVAKKAAQGKLNPESSKAWETEFHVRCVFTPTTGHTAQSLLPWLVTLSAAKGLAGAEVLRFAQDGSLARVTAGGTCHWRGVPIVDCENS